MITNEQTTIALQHVRELISALEGEDGQGYSDIIHGIDLPVSTFEQFCSWSNESYTRNCISCCDKFELILLCWEEGQFTPIHDHGGEECWVRVIQGEFKETIYQLDEAGELNPVRTAITKVGDISYMKDFMGCHRLENTHSGKSISLHLYAKPILNCQLFDEEAMKFVDTVLEYDTVSKLVVN